MSDVICCKKNKQDGGLYSVFSEYSRLEEENGRMCCADCGQVYGKFVLGGNFILPWMKKQPWLHRFMLKYLLGLEWRWI